MRMIKQYRIRYTMYNSIEYEFLQYKGIDCLCTHDAEKTDDSFHQGDFGTGFLKPVDRNELMDIYDYELIAIYDSNIASRSSEWILTSILADIEENRIKLCDFTKCGAVNGWENLDIDLHEKWVNNSEIKGAKIRYLYDRKNGVEYRPPLAKDKTIDVSEIYKYYLHYNRYRNYEYTDPYPIETTVLTTNEGLEYKVYDGSSIEITKYTGNESNVIIPETIDGIKITRIGYQAFNECENLVSISIPDSVTEIGSFAFCNCINLSDIIIPDNVFELGGCTFYKCKSLTSINIPDSVTGIRTSVFFDCSGLTDINLPDTLITIEARAFSDCTGLKNINIPESVTNIGREAFSNCRNLKTISIPDGITCIEYRAFTGCMSLTGVNIPESVTYIDDSAFYNCENLSAITIPDKTTEIKYCAFANCKRLKSITIPDSVTKISSSAFYGCCNLTIYGNENSYAQTYAKENNIPFEVISNEQ